MTLASAALVGAAVLVNFGQSLINQAITRYNSFSAIIPESMSFSSRSNYPAMYKGLREKETLTNQEVCHLTERLFDTETWETAGIVISFVGSILFCCAACVLLRDIYRLCSQIIA